MQIFWEREKSNEVVDYYHTTSAQETKQTNKQNSLLTAAVSCEKMSCLIRIKSKKNKKTKKNEISE